MAAERLEVEGLALVRGDRLLFEGLSFGLAPGEALLLTGANGAGKTSLLRAIAGLLVPAAGMIRNPHATAFQGPELALKPDALLRRELRFWAGLDASPPERLAAAIDAMEVAPLLDLPVAYLSAGQRARAALARLMASGASLWLLDEPSATLDSASTDRLIAALRRHQAAGGLLIAATHLPLAIEARTLRLGP
jgi:heme exporter protein A